MKLENQIVSLELAKKLKELGVKQESLWYWNDVSAFTVAELGEMLPFKGRFGYTSGRNSSGEYYCMDDNNEFDVFFAENEADARAKMLIYLIENKFIEGEDEKGERE